MSASLSVRLSLSFADQTDVPLDDEDTNSIQTDNANRVTQGNVAMHATGDQLWNQCNDDANW